MMGLALGCNRQSASCIKYSIDRLKQLFRIDRLVLVIASIAFFSFCAAAQKASTKDKTPSSEPPPSGKPASVARGRIVYNSHCGICHFSASEAMKIGPGLKGIYKREKFPSGGRVDDASMEKWIGSGGKNMPPFKAVLDMAQVRDLIAYLKTL